MIKYGVNESLIKEGSAKTEEELKKEEEAKKRRIPKKVIPRPKKPPYFK